MITKRKTTKEASKHYRFGNRFGIQIITTCNYQTLVIVQDKDKSLIENTTLQMQLSCRDKMDAQRQKAKDDMNNHFTNMSAINCNLIRTQPEKEKETNKQLHKM